MIRRICYSLLKKILLYLAKTVSYLSLVRGENNLKSRSNGWLRSMRRGKNGEDGIRHNEILRNPGWKVCQLRTECQVNDKILRTKNEINVRTKIKIEIARDGPIPIFYDNVL